MLEVGLTVLVRLIAVPGVTGWPRDAVGGGVPTAAGRMPCLEDGREPDIVKFRAMRKYKRAFESTEWDYELLCVCCQLSGLITSICKL
jgi:hypothetical protein